MAKILVIDDERAIRNTLKEILEMESHEVETAENGRIALDKAKQQQFDLIFSDIKMPEMDGMELLTALNRLQFPFWDVLHRRGYRVFATAGDSAGAGQNDAKVASRAFTELYAYFDPKDDGQKYERGRAERAMNLWTGKLRKDQKFDGTVEEETISLDED